MRIRAATKTGQGRRPAALLRLAAILAAAIAGLAGGAPASALELEVAGQTETVFDPVAAGCGPEIIPDAGARAFRDAAGTVHLVAAHFDAVALVGPELGQVRPDCREIFTSLRDPKPADFADRSWPVAFHTRDGRTIDALFHNEHQGQRDPVSCPSRQYRRCWYNSVTAGVSTDGGRTFRLLDPARRLVAALPYRYVGDAAGKPVGYFSPSNIVELDGFFYTLVFAEDYRDQERGVCVLRTPDLADPGAWRAWDGHDFTVRFVDPYAEPEPAAAGHVCTPVRKAGFAFPITGLVRHAPSGQFIAVMSGMADVRGRPVSAIFYSVSRNLTEWTPIRVLSATPDMTLCRRVHRLYAALIDPDSPSRNFETADDSLYLYTVRYPSESCRDDRRRILVRQAVAVRADGRQGR